MAVLRWSDTGAVVQSLVLDVDDAAITNAATDADKLGIDCPLGWPDDFLLFLQEHHAGEVVAPQEVAGREWRRKLAAVHPGQSNPSRHADGCGAG
jgi:hypothetical protein